MRKHIGETGFLGLPMEPYRCIFFGYSSNQIKNGLFLGQLPLINHHLSSRMVFHRVYPETNFGLVKQMGTEFWAPLSPPIYSSVFLLQSSFWWIYHIFRHTQIIVFVTYSIISRYLLLSSLFYVGKTLFFTIPDSTINGVVFEPSKHGWFIALVILNCCSHDIPILLLRHHPRTHWEPHFRRARSFPGPVGRWSVWSMGRYNVCVYIYIL